MSANGPGAIILIVQTREGEKFGLTEEDIQRFEKMDRIFKANPEAEATIRPKLGLDMCEKFDAYLEHKAIEELKERRAALVQEKQKSEDRVFELNLERQEHEKEIVNARNQYVARLKSLFGITSSEKGLSSSLKM